MNEKNQNANTKTICGTSRQALFNGDDLAEKQDDPGSVPPSGCGQDVLRDSRQRETAQDEERTTAGQQEQEEGRITRACRSAEEALKEIAALPSIPFAHRRHLPAASGVYFVLEQGQCAYVGQSLNIRQRWMSHHKIAKLREREGVTISWALVDATSLYDVEIYYINLLAANERDLHRSPARWQFGRNKRSPLGRSPCKTNTTVRGKQANPSANNGLNWILSPRLRRTGRFNERTISAECSALAAVLLRGADRERQD